MARTGTAHRQPVLTGFLRAFTSTLSCAAGSMTLERGIRGAVCVALTFQVQGQVKARQPLPNQGRSNHVEIGLNNISEKE